MDKSKSKSKRRSSSRSSNRSSVSSSGSKRTDTHKGGGNRYRDGSRSPKRFRHNSRDRGSHGKRYREDRKYQDRYNDRGDRSKKYGSNKNERHRRSRSKSFDHANARWGKASKEAEKSDGRKKQEEEKQKPNFSLSGKLTEETNTYRGVVIKYSEPPEARKPRRRWRLYPFKGDKALQTLYIHRESAYLIGRDRKVVDLPVDHPSCSKQHAALQYRLVPFTRPDGTQGKRVRPYIIDLDSANGTFINNRKIEPRKYVELLEKDVIKFGFSSREYVLLHENSKDEGLDDDVKQDEEEEDNKTSVHIKEEN